MLPKLLVVNTTAWNEKLPSKTMMDLFGCWDSARICQVYTKTEMPNTKICNSFFQINENNVLKSIFRKKICCGQRVFNNQCVNLKENNVEHKRYAFFKKINSKFFRLCREFVWMLGRWKNENFKKFLQEEKPDVLFLPIYPTIYTALIEKFIIRQTNKNYCVYFADDNFTYKSCSFNLFDYLHRFILRRTVKKIVNGADTVFVISEMMKDEYDKIFNTDCKILTRFVDVSNQKKDTFKGNIKTMCYCGKLGLGRKKSLYCLGENISSKYELAIYSQDNLSKQDIKFFKKNKNIVFKGKIDPLLVADELAKYDCLILAESLKKRYYKKARLSFSTKVVDYLLSGKPIVYIGGNNIATSNYLGKNNAAIICTSLSDIKNLNKKLEDKDLLRNICNNSYTMLATNHSCEKLKTSLIECITRCYLKKVNLS